MTLDSSQPGLGRGSDGAQCLSGSGARLTRKPGRPARVSCGQVSCPVLTNVMTTTAISTSAHAPYWMSARRSLGACTIA